VGEQHDGLQREVAQDIRPGRSERATVQADLEGAMIGARSGRWIGAIGLALVGCAGDGEKSDTGATRTDTDTTDTDIDTDFETDGSCSPIVEGGWTANGSCFGMLMTATLTLSAQGCTFAFSDWDMAMDVPEGGKVSGADEVALTGPGWESCTGESDGATMSGTCDDGCTFELIAGGTARRAP
jgi:hypothetical protein